ncbi:MAG: hypothetical protein IJ228_11195 [Succinivibrio sp.]|nr:hypothetical protein [Succinivibrio sp.]
MPGLDKNKNSKTTEDYLRAATLFSDLLCRECLNESSDAAQLLLRACLHNSELKVRPATLPAPLVLQEGSAPLITAWCEDDTGQSMLARLYLAETLKEVEQRAEAESALLCMAALEHSRGTAIARLSVEQLPAQQLIYILRADPFKIGRASYELRRVYTNVRDTPQLKGKSHIRLINGIYDGNDLLGEVLEDMRKSDPNLMKLPALREAVKLLKPGREDSLEIKERKIKRFEPLLGELEL